MSNTDNEPVTVDFHRILQKTELGVLLRFGGNLEPGQEVWLPRSQIELDEEHKTVEMPEWLAIEKELV